VWNTETLESVAVLEGHTDAVRALAASPVEDLKYVFSGSDDSRVRVW
jgi:F-box and WD-40 domain protein 7